MKKKLTEILLSAAMVITMIPASALAAEKTGAVPDTECASATEEYYAYFVYTDKGVSAYTVGKDDTKGRSLLASTEKSGVTTSGAGFVLDGTTVTITSETAGHECHYFFKGNCPNGNIYVEKDGSDDIEMELQGLKLTEPDEGSCPINIKGGTTRVNLKAKKGTRNTLTDASHVDTNGEAVKPKACLNASKKLDIGGKGMLTINGNNKNGIKSDTKIEISSSLTLNVNSVDNAISADKELCIADDFTGTINVKSGGKGLCAAFDKEELAEGEDWTEYNNVIIRDGSINIDAADDAIHSNREVVIVGGRISIRSGDDGIHADEHVAIGTGIGKDGLKLNITKAFEGVEALVVDIYGGDIDIVSEDDGVNASNKAIKELIPDKKERKSYLGQNPDESCNINVYGGDIYVLAGKDALDSNGNITLSGGNCVLFASSGGATKTSDALDSGNKLFFMDNGANGATVFGASASGRMQTVPEEGGQKYFAGAMSLARDDIVTVVDDGKTKEYKMDCADGYIMYTSPTYDNGAVAAKYSRSYVKGFKVKAGDASFTARWTKPGKSAQKKFSKYQIRYSDKENMSGAVVKNIRKSRTSIKVGRLIAGTTYYVQLRTCSKGYWSDWTTATVTPK